MTKINTFNIGSVCRDEFLTVCTNATQQQLEFAEKVCNSMYASTLQTDKQVHVVTVRCGFGKSIAQKTFLNHITDDEFAFTKEQWGLLTQLGVIYVTDRIGRLEEVYGYGNIMEHCYLLSSESNCNIAVEEQIVDQQYYPILLMTTQRYFQMDVAGIRALKKWRNYTGEHERKLIIFDEKPQFIDMFSLSANELHRVENALVNVLEYEGKGRLIASFGEIKSEVLHEWDELSMYLSENKIKKSYTWVPADNQAIDSAEFYSLVKNVNLPDHVMQTIAAIKRRKSNGCFYVNAQTGKVQNRYYTIPMNNLDKILLEDFSYWIFDATAYNDIEYLALSNRLPFDFFVANDIRKENCQIVLTNFNTSRNKMDDEKQEKLLSYLSSQSKDTVIITYKFFENIIQKEYPEYATMHFGNTRGNNSLREATKLLQIGLNRQHDRDYLGVLLELYPEERERLNTMSRPEIDSYIKEITHMSSVLYNDERMNAIMISKIATDLEQNIFRSKIRQFGSDEFVRTEVICSAKYSAVFEMALEKYGIPYEVNEESFEEKRAAREGSHAQKVLDCLEQIPVMTEFTTRDLYQKAGLTAKQFDKVRNTHEINDLLDSYRTGRGRYMKFF